MASSGEVCLITPDIKKGKKPDHEPTVDRWEEILREAGVTSVSINNTLTYIILLLFIMKSTMLPK